MSVDLFNTGGECRGATSATHQSHNVIFSNALAHAPAADEGAGASGSNELPPPIGSTAGAEDDDGGLDDEGIEWTQDPCLVKCLFSDETFDSVDAMLAHVLSSYSFDFRETKRRLGLDIYGAIRLANFIRAKVRENELDAASIIASIEPGASFLEDDLFLKPVLDDDAFLFELDDFEDDEDNSDSLQAAGTGAMPPSPPAAESGKKESREEESYYSRIRPTVSHTNVTLSEPGLRPHVAVVAALPETKKHCYPP